MTFLPIRMLCLERSRCYRTHFSCLYLYDRRICPTGQSDSPLISLTNYQFSRTAGPHVDKTDNQLNYSNHRQFEFGTVLEPI